MDKEKKWYDLERYLSKNTQLWIVVALFLVVGTNNLYQNQIQMDEKIHAEAEQISQDLRNSVIHIEPIEILEPLDVPPLELPKSKDINNWKEWD